MNSMKNLCAWAKGKSLLLLIVGEIFADFADALHDFLNAMHGTPASPSGRACAKILAEYPGTEIRGEYYRNPDKAAFEFCRSVLVGCGLSPEEANEKMIRVFQLRYAESIANEIQSAIAKMTSEELSILVAEGREFINSFLRLRDGDMGVRLSGNDTARPNAAFVQFASQPAVKFMINVILPCAAAYQTTPDMLLGKAVGGDEEALKCILTVDKHAIDLPEVAAIYHSRIATDFARYQVTIYKYLNYSLPILSKAEIKQAVASLLYQLFTNINKCLKSLPSSDFVKRFKTLNTLTMPGIQALFTAFERDAGRIKEPQWDPDTSDYGNFRQKIYRMRKNLPPLPGQ